MLLSGRQYLTGQCIINFNYGITYFKPYDDGTTINFCITIFQTQASSYFETVTYVFTWDLETFLAVPLLVAAIPNILESLISHCQKACKDKEFNKNKQLDLNFVNVVRSNVYLLIVVIKFTFTSQWV